MFPHRKPGIETRGAMVNASLQLGMESKNGATREAEKAISEVTGHRYAVTTATGDSAILAALSAVGGKVALPDQGIWRGFKKHAKLLGIDVIELPTDLGLIDPGGLPGILDAHGPRALCLSSFAGYVAEQPLAEISKICGECDCLLIEDASGGVGDARLASSKYSDVIVCSAGAPKVLNLVKGGFLSTGKAELYERIKEIARTCSLNPVVCAGLVEELKGAPKRVSVLLRYSELLKEEFQNVLHPEKRGLSTGILLEGNPKKIAKDARAKGLVTDLGSTLLTTCPRYERFLEKGIVIELKKLEIFEMDEEDVLSIAAVLNGCI